MHDDPLVANSKRRYQCTHPGCDKAYTKPSRLEEHNRSHTGQRPFVCATCKKSYLRESHLQAHARGHLPESARPFFCSEPGCLKRFMSSHHLRRHESLHNSAKPFACPEADCDQAFTKHHQLREHICKTHAPPGTKPYRCDREDCTKSFSTNQHLRAHSKVHDDKRYTCVRPECLPTSNKPTAYFPTWSALQYHTRTAHPPKCTHPACNGKTFSSHHGLRAHQRIHEQREAAEVELDTDAPDSQDDGNQSRPPKKRRGGDLGRDWKCEAEGCEKDFKSKNALATHVNVAHLGRRDHICPHTKCKRAFGYKHLLQRHMLRHSPTSDSASHHSTSDSETDDDESEIAGNDLRTRYRKPQNITRMDIEAITGNAYAMHAKARVHAATALQCPYPHLDALSFVVNANLQHEGELVGGSQHCSYVFSRAYDLWRHLRTAHEIEANKNSVDEWVQSVKQENSVES